MLDKNKPKPDTFNTQQRNIIESMQGNRILIPILLGIGVIVYLFWKRFQPEDFREIEWKGYTLGWIALAIVVLFIKHLSYSWRLRILTRKGFSWRKCIELIFIWEFASAISPTAVGGSAVAFFVLAQEKLPTARTALIVLYTVVLDGIFFLSTLPLLYLIFGSGMIRPNVTSFSDLQGWGYYFLFAYAAMFAYTLLFYLGIFVQPRPIRRFLGGVTRIWFLKRFHRDAVKLGSDMMVASADIKRESWDFHAKAFLATLLAWSARFILLACLLLAFLPNFPRNTWDLSELYARLEAMFIVMMFSPTPGGVGFVEILFGGFLTDYVSNPTLATVVSTIWRLLTYYSYLLAGAILVPAWLRKVMQQKRTKKTIERPNAS